MLEFNAGVAALAFQRWNLDVGIPELEVRKVGIPALEIDRSTKAQNTDRKAEAHHIYVYIYRKT